MAKVELSISRLKLFGALEPKVLAYALEVEPQLPAQERVWIREWFKLFSAMKFSVSKLKADLGCTRFHFHESGLLTRRLGLGALTDILRELPVDFPMEHGRDCLDCGGEGAYVSLFENEAIKMVQDLEDRYKATHVLTFSRRCAEHWKKNTKAQVLCLMDYLVEES